MQNKSFVYRGFRYSLGTRRLAPRYGGSWKLESIFPDGRCHHIQESPLVTIYDPVTGLVNPGIALCERNFGEVCKKALWRPANPTQSSNSLSFLGWIPDSNVAVFQFVECLPIRFGSGVPPPLIRNGFIIYDADRRSISEVNTTKIVNYHIQALLNPLDKTVYHLCCEVRAVAGGFSENFLILGFHKKGGRVCEYRMPGSLASVPKLYAEATTRTIYLEDGGATKWGRIDSNSRKFMPLQEKPDNIFELVDISNGHFSALYVSFNAERVTIGGENNSELLVTFPNRSHGRIYYVLPDGIEYKEDNRYYQIPFIVEKV